MHRRHIHTLHSFCRSSAQRGAVLVQFALLAGVLVSILGGVQIGYMYFAKRDLQRTADLAALEAVNALTYGDDSTCTSRAKPAAEQSITSNLRVSLESETRSIECGHWNAGKADNARFNISTSKNNPLNSARIQLRGEALKLLPFTGSRVVAATAIAAKVDEPVAAFSVGSRLLRFENEAFLGKVLTAVGLKIDDLRVLDSDGVATAAISPSGLLKSIGNVLGIQELINIDLAALTPNGLANIPKITVADLVTVAASLVESKTAELLIKIANALSANAEISDIKIPLIGKPGESAIFTFIGLGSDNSPVGAAADVRIGLGDILKTALAIGSNGHAAELNSSLNIGENRLLTIKLTIVEPPTIAVGPATNIRNPSSSPAGDTQARSAQIRLSLYLGGDEKGSKNLPLLGLLGVDVKLYVPIHLDVVRSTGTLEKIMCSANEGLRKVNISVNSSVGDVCVGTLNSNGVCTDAELVYVKLLHDSILKMSLKGHLAPKLLSSSGSLYSQPPSASSCPFNSKDECLIEKEINSTTMSGPNGLRLGSFVVGLLDSILKLIRNLADNSNLEGFLGKLIGFILELLGILSQVIDFIVGLVSLIITPLLNGLGQVLDGLITKILGLEIGRADVKVLDIQCDTAQLVY